MKVYKYKLTTSVHQFTYKDIYYVLAETLEEARNKLAPRVPDWIEEVSVTDVQKLILADDLEGKEFDVLHHLRTLPEDQARFLLDAYVYKVDGDNGYGSWPNPMVDPEKWY